MRLLLLLIGSWTALSAAECTVRVLEPGASIDGAMAAGDCTAQDILPTTSTVSVTALRPLLTQAYSLTVGDGGGVLTLSVASSSFPPAVVLVNAKNEILALQGGTVTAAAAVQLSVSAGVYQVLAVSQTTATGNYTLKNTLEARRDCAPPDWKFGETLSGELTVSDCRILDVLTPSTTQRPVDVYKVTVAENTVALFEMAANAFRPVLAVMDVKTGKLVNDGAQSNNGLGAEIYIGLPAGEYYLLVSASTVSGGAYALRSASEPARTCVEEPLELPGSVRSALANSDCRLVDYIPFSGNFSFIRAYKMEVPRKGVVTLEQNSTQVDSYLNLLRPDKSVIAEDDEGGGNGNARIAVTLNPGTYTVLANSYDEGEIGAFELKSSFADPRECPVEELGLSASVSGSLAAADCRLHEMVEDQNVPSQARRYQVTLEQPGTLTLELSSTAFALGLALFDADGKVLDLGSAQIRADTIRGGRYLPAGKYTVFVYTGNLRFGAFTLRSSFAQ